MDTKPRVAFDELSAEFKRVLTGVDFTDEKAAKIADTFARNSLDGVYTHGLNRFPVFVADVKKGLIKPDAEPELVENLGAMEIWEGNLAPGIYNAKKSMHRAMELAGKNGIGCVAIKNTNHWMRGGTYGWQAADAGYAAVCFTNASAGMPPWGGTEPRLGNNPMVIAIPRKEGNIVLDMALSQYSFGKLQQYVFAGDELPFDGGYNTDGKITRKPQEIMDSKRALPIGYWKGSGLSLLLDVLLVALTGGKSVGEITASGHESSCSQCFIAFKKTDYHPLLINQILEYTASSPADKEGGKVSYPGENTLRARKENTEKGIPVEEKIWKQVQAM